MLENKYAPIHRIKANKAEYIAMQYGMFQGHLSLPPLFCISLSPSENS